MMRDKDHMEALARVHCIIRHCQQTERDGLPNSLDHLRKIEQDARALEDLMLEDDTSQPIHLEER